MVGTAQGSPMDTDTRHAPDRAGGLATVFVVAAVAGLACGGVGWVVGADEVADISWAATTALGLVAASAWMIASLRAHRPGVDILAVLALAGTLLTGEYVAGALVTVMLATGRVLEVRAAGRAERELRALVARTPQVVHRYEADGLTTPSLDAVVPGDLLLVGPGEVVPVDGRVEGHDAVLDESALTGESLPVTHIPGDSVRSGVVNAGGAFDLRATTSAAESTYAGVVRLVEAASAEQAPFVRLADRYALWFVPLAVVMAAVAWAVSGDVQRAVAVLVVATPCPLLLAAPIAIVSGMSRCASRGVVVKDGGALEQLARGEVLLFDKTGTITRGRPTLTDVALAPGAPFDTTTLLALSASLDQVSPHVLASSIVLGARAAGATLVLPTDAEEQAGAGIRGVVGGRDVRIGRWSWIAPGTVPDWVRAVRRRAELDGSTTVFVGVDGRPAGAFLLDDPVRTDAARTLRELRQAGIRRAVLVTGDRAEIAEMVGAMVGADDVLSERTPGEKVDAVLVERAHGPTIMVGDGVNDAPALAAADVGVALGARGSTATSETADVVLNVDRLDRLADAILIARRAFTIARQSAVVGMGLSLVAMVAAAFGLLPPALGALLQEAIDVAVILNALRVAFEHPAHLRLEGDDAALGLRFSGEHEALRRGMETIRQAADALGRTDPAESTALLVKARRFLDEELLPHEAAEDSELYPVLANALGGEDPVGTMSRGHAEIVHLTRRLGRLVDDLPPEGPGPDERQELRRVLYGLDAVLRLHFAQEDEGYFSLIDDPD
jgi:heavy metal translocating P-type ATPase